MKPLGKILFVLFIPFRWSLILKTDIGVSNLNKGREEESTVCDELFFRTAWSKEKRKKGEIKTKEEWKVALNKINFPKKIHLPKVKKKSKWKWKKVERKMKEKMKNEKGLDISNSIMGLTA